jgi:hypothetical protein
MKYLSGTQYPLPFPPPFKPLLPYFIGIGSRYQTYLLLVAETPKEKQS